MIIKKKATSVSRKKTRTVHTPKSTKSGNGNNITLKMVKDIAKTKGINSGKMKKAEIIKNIQRAEGNFDCFGTATDGYCDQLGCMWITTCLQIK
jgi:hypothetical protein